MVVDCERFEYRRALALDGFYKYRSSRLYATNLMDKSYYGATRSILAPPRPTTMMVSIGTCFVIAHQKCLLNVLLQVWQYAFSNKTEAKELPACDGSISGRERSRALCLRARLACHLCTILGRGIVGSGTVPGECTWFFAPI